MVNPTEKRLLKRFLSPTLGPSRRSDLDEIPGGIVLSHEMICSACVILMRLIYRGMFELWRRARGEQPCWPECIIADASVHAYWSLWCKVLVARQCNVNPEHELWVALHISLSLLHEAVGMESVAFVQFVLYGGTDIVRMCSSESEITLWRLQCRCN